MSKPIPPRRFNGESTSTRRTLKLNFDQSLASGLHLTDGGVASGTAGSIKDSERKKTMKTMAKTILVMMAAVAVTLLMAAPAMAWQPAEESQFSKPLNEDGIQLIDVGLPVVDMQGLPDEMDEGAIPGCEDLGDPDSLNCPGEEDVDEGDSEGTDEGDDEGIDDGGEDEITPDDTPEDTPEDDTPDLTPPDDTPDTNETPPVTPPTTTTTSNLPKTGTYLLTLAVIGMIVAAGAFGARVIFRRRMR